MLVIVLRKLESPNFSSQSAKYSFMNNIFVYVLQANETAEKQRQWLNDKLYRQTEPSTELWKSRIFNITNTLHATMLRFLLTSSLNNLLVSFLIGSISWTWPAEKPTRRDTLSAVAVKWLKSWHVGCVPLYILLSIGLLKSAAWKESKQN